MKPGQRLAFAKASAAAAASTAAISSTRTASVNASYPGQEQDELIDQVVRAANNHADAWDEDAQRGAPPAPAPAAAAGPSVPVSGAELGASGAATEGAELGASAAATEDAELGASGAPTEGNTNKLAELGASGAATEGNMRIESSLYLTPQVRKAMEDIVGFKAKAFQNLGHVHETSRMSHRVQQGLENVFSEYASHEKTTPLTNDDFLAWSRAKRGRKDARGTELVNNALVNMCYLAWTTAVMLEELPDAVRTKCIELEERAEKNRESESDAAQERADGYDEIRDEFEEYANECEGTCTEPAGNLRNALEAGDLNAAVEAIENGDLFLDIGVVTE